MPRPLNGSVCERTRGLRGPAYTPMSKLAVACGATSTTGVRIEVTSWSVAAASPLATPWTSAIEPTSLLAAVGGAYGACSANAK